MSASNKGVVWKKNLMGAKEPFFFPVNFQAGASQAIKSGEILDLSGSVAPLASDKSMAGIIAISACEIRSGDLGGYRLALIPRPGDVFEFALATAAAPTPGASLYWSTSQILTTTGSNIIASVVDESMIPLQGFNSVDPSYDAGTTIRTTGSVLVVFKAAASYWAALQL